MKNISRINLRLISGGGYGDEGSFSIPASAPDNGRCACVINPDMDPMFKVVYLARNINTCGTRCCNNMAGSLFAFSTEAGTAVLGYCPNAPRGVFRGFLPLDALFKIYNFCQSCHK